MRPEEGFGVQFPEMRTWAGDSYTGPCDLGTDRILPSASWRFSSQRGGCNHDGVDRNSPRGQE